MSLDIKEFKAGVCFLCHQACDGLGYVHQHCAQAYLDEKEKRLTTALNDSPGMPYE